MSSMKRGSGFVQLKSLSRLKRIRYGAITRYESPAPLPRPRWRRGSRIAALWTEQQLGSECPFYRQSFFRGLATDARRRALRGASRREHRATLFEPAAERASPRHILLRRLHAPLVQLCDEVRERDRLA